MNEIRKNMKTIIICIIIAVVIIIGTVFIDKKDIILMGLNSEDKTDTVIKKYEANEFIPIYVEEEDVVKKYLNDYKNNMIYDINEAYNMLNASYRDVRFGNIEAYKEYVNSIISLSTYSMEVDRYSVTSINGSKIFNVYDKSGYQYIIKEKSIMDYEIYLDEHTVVIR